MSFYDILKDFKDKDILGIINATTSKDIEEILSKDTISSMDFMQLLSPVATEFIERMAIKSNTITKSNFGNTMLLYTPMYISNHCINRCIYCGYNITNKKIARKKLSYDEIEHEAKFISERGMKHVLLLTGESPTDCSTEYLCKSVDILSNHFNSIGIEIYPMDTVDYTKVISSGVTGLTVYQETYDEKVYDNVHISGPKKDFLYRLDAPERGCIAGMREVNIGALLGLSNPISDAFYTGIHGEYLINKYPEVEIGISVPRIRPHGGELHDIYPVDDIFLVQIILAMRIFMPRLSISLSTREQADLRDNLVPLGITKMSAGVSTAVGGHTNNESSTNQFEISDIRSFKDIKSMLLCKGYQPVHSDWIQF